MIDSINRMAAMTARYYYLLRSSWLRLAELIFWPAMQMLVWGFLYTYLYDSKSSMASTGGMLLGAVLLWDVPGRDRAPAPAAAGSARPGW